MDSAGCYPVVRQRRESSESGSYGFALERDRQPRRCVLKTLPISPVIVKDSLAQIAPPTAAARRLVNASLSPNTRRAYAGAIGQLDAWLAGRPWPPFGCLLGASGP